MESEHDWPDDDESDNPSNENFSEKCPKDLGSPQRMVASYGTSNESNNQWNGGTRGSSKVSDLFLRSSSSGQQPNLRRNNFQQQSDCLPLSPYPQSLDLIISRERAQMSSIKLHLYFLKRIEEGENVSLLDFSVVIGGRQSCERLCDDLQMKQNYQEINVIKCVKLKKLPGDFLYFQMYNAMHTHNDDYNRKVDVQSVEAQEPLYNEHATEEPIHVHLFCDLKLSTLQLKEKIFCCSFKLSQIVVGYHKVIADVPLKFFLKNKPQVSHCIFNFASVLSSKRENYFFTKTFLLSSAF
ncbi:hypothetical protein HELRODRAFT_181078 [Helobdella robusta]|uniref:Uncharacterized protein n=1 Tax=Helobdella robusta TaxID=6412 RepID=T1FGL2_HELRO|nr:hypothetical protein HELRODRAFT_181078 [Helobdella robusta]ESN93332.1 hypothetical protein HELRODRAFT_181078 [Helobdella robusta]